jgi:very-short-patch-repair endonuclease
MNLNRRKTKAAYRIAQNNTKAEDTAPERAFEELFAGKVIKPPPITITDPESVLIYDFKPDFQFIGTNVLVEIDGPYHRTKIQQRKTEWRDSRLLAMGYRVLHIDTELLDVKEYHIEVAQCTAAFLNGTRLKEHLFA